MKANTNHSGGTGLRCVHSRQEEAHKLIKIEDKEYPIGELFAISANNEPVHEPNHRLKVQTVCKKCELYLT